MSITPGGATPGSVNGANYSAQWFPFSPSPSPQKGPTRPKPETVDISVPVEVQFLDKSEIRELLTRVYMVRKEDAFHLQLSTPSDVFFDWACVVDEAGFSELELVSSFSDFARVVSSLLQNCLRDPSAFACMLIENECGMAFHVVNRIGDYRIVELLELQFVSAATTEAEQRARIQAKFDELSAKYEKAAASLQELTSMSSPRTTLPIHASPHSGAGSSGRKALPLLRKSTGVHSSRNGGLF